MGRFSANVRKERSDFRVLAERVHRDPCVCCGVRGDIGCKHQNRTGTFEKVLSDQAEAGA